MTLLSLLYGIIIYLAMNAPSHEKNVVYGINTTDKRYMKAQMELIGKLESNDTSKIGMLSSA